MLAGVNFRVHQLQDQGLEAGTILNCSCCSLICRRLTKYSCLARKLEGRALLSSIRRAESGSIDGLNVHAGSESAKPWTP